MRRLPVPVRDETDRGRRAVALAALGARLPGPVRATRDVLDRAVAADYATRIADDAAMDPLAGIVGAFGDRAAHLVAHGEYGWPDDVRGVLDREAASLAEEASDAVSVARGIRRRHSR